MKTIRRFITTLFALALLATTLPTHAQVVPLPRSVEPVFGAVVADDTDVLGLIQFIAPGTTTNNSGTVAIAANGSLTFLQGAQGAEAASTELECPVSGALGGIIDVTNAACNTVGEVADIINASANWRFVPLASFRTDVWTSRVLTQSATRATNLAGFPVLWDTSTAFQASVVLSPFTRMSDFIRPGTRTVQHDVYKNSRVGVFLGSATSTYGSGTSNIRFYSVKVNQTSPTKYSEVVTQVYFTPGGASTVAQTYDFRDIGLWGRSGEKLIARLDNSAAMTVVTFRTYGLFARDANAVPGRP